MQVGKNLDVYDLLRTGGKIITRKKEVAIKDITVSKQISDHLEV